MVASVSVLETLKSRGFIAQLTDETAIAELLAKPTVLYTGYDPTADSLHVGSLVTIMALMHLERAGHQILVLVGDGTAKVGDPSGKSQMRPMLEDAHIAANAAAIAKQFAPFLRVGQSTKVVHNGDWLGKLSYIDFLRTIGRHFSVNRMLAAEAYKQRLERGLSFIEFNYQILQAYDFLQLHKTHACMLQIGGDDQWGNILAGVDLVRRVSNATVHGLTLPLLTTASGDKMGKTQQGAVWLDAKKLSPFAYYQYFVNTHDDDVAKLLGLFTLLPMAEIEQVKSLQGSDLNAVKSILAFEACALAHGLEAANSAHGAAQVAFGGRHVPPKLLPSSTIARQAGAGTQNMPQSDLCAANLQGGIALVDLIVQSGFAASKNAARRLIEQGGIKLGEVVFSDPQQVITTEHFASGSQILRAGKKRAHRLSVTTTG